MRKTMHKVKSIKIERAEGPISLCRKHKFNSLENADRHMTFYENSYTKLGYDKHNITITWEDNTEYKFRLDAQHPENPYYQNNKISYRIKQSKDYYLGLKNPDGFDRESVTFFEYLNKNLEV